MKLAEIIGVSVSDATVEIRMAKASVTENSRNSRPAAPPSSSSGRKAAISDTEIEITVKPISFEPTRAALSGDSPSSRCLSMFSIITMASSTTKPTEVASAISEMLSIEKCAAYMQAQVPASASGTVTPAAAVGVRRRRNTNTTPITRMIVAPSVRIMSEIEARIVTVRSFSTEMSMPAGRKRCSSGSSVLMWSTVWMTLALACLRT